MKKTITLEEVKDKNSILPSPPSYQVLLDGKLHGELYFNMTGYTGCYLPTPPAPESGGKVGNLLVGERPISAYKREISRLNREWDDYNKKSHQ